MSLRDKMLELFGNTHVEENYEITGNILIQVSLAVMLKSKVYIVAENDLHICVRQFKSWGLDVHKVVCSTPQSLKQIDDVEIVSLKYLLSDKTPGKFFFFFTCDINAEGKADFFLKNFFKIPVDEIPNRIYCIDNNDHVKILSNPPTALNKNTLFYYQTHKNELMHLFDSFHDEYSKETLFNYVRAYMSNGICYGNKIPTQWKYFFGGEHERLYRHLDGECWINCGAYIGDTIFAYFSHAFKPKKIYAFEGNKKYYDILLRNLSLLPPEKRDLVEPLNEFIDDTTDFKKILGGNKCTLLNADIEGSELAMLNSMKDIIRSDRPVIAICVYHLKEDLVAIPQFIRAVCDNYTLFLRKYTPSYGNPKLTGELVLYAVPVERAYQI